VLRPVAVPDLTDGLDGEVDDMEQVHREHNSMRRPEEGHHFGVSAGHGGPG
jgi:hypothetical protein